MDYFIRSIRRKNLKIRGFSLVSVLVGLSLLTILGLALANIITNSFKSEVYLRSKQDITDFKNMTSSQLSLGSTCTLNLLNKPLPSVGTDMSLSSLRPLDSSGTNLDLSKTIVSPNQTLTPNLFVQSIYIQNLGSAGGPNSYNANLVFQFSIQNAMGPPVVTRNIPLILTTSGSPAQITGCLVAAGGGSSGGGSGSPPGGANCGSYIHSQIYAGTPPACPINSTPVAPMYQCLNGTVSTISNGYCSVAPINSSVSGGATQ